MTMNKATENLSDSDNVGSVKPRFRRVTILFLVLLAISALVVGICLWIVLVEADHSPPHIRVLRPEIESLCYVGGFFGFVLFMIAAVWLCSSLGKQLVIAFAVMVLGVLALPLAMGLNFMRSLDCPEWYVNRELVGPDGVTYCLLQAFHFRDYSLALARRSEERAITRGLEIFMPVGGRWGGLGRVIRPANGLQHGIAQLYVSESGVIVAIYDEWCRFTYDPKTHEYMGRDERPRRISPFLLMGAKTALYQPDVDVILDNVSRGSREEFLGAHDKNLTEALDHPNPEVRQLARRIVEIYRAASAGRSG